MRSKLESKAAEGRTWGFGGLGPPKLDGRPGESAKH
jgi:hypothetical protein